jgi:hypothetical protein
MDSASARPATTHGSGQRLLHQNGEEVQGFGTVKQFPTGLSYDTRMYSCQRLNRVLADSQILYALYKKDHWTLRGATFYPLHQLLDGHASAQLEIVDELAERVQSLGGLVIPARRVDCDSPATERHRVGARDALATVGGARDDPDRRSRCRFARGGTWRRRDQRLAGLSGHKRWRGPGVVLGRAPCRYPVVTALTFQGPVCPTSNPNPMSCGAAAERG